MGLAVVVVLPTEPLFPPTGLSVLVWCVWSVWCTSGGVFPDKENSHEQKLLDGRCGWCCRSVGVPCFCEADADQDKRLKRSHVMRPTSFLGLAGLVVVGVIIADFLIHPSGTTAAANGLVSIEKPSFNALLGSTS